LGPAVLPLAGKGGSELKYNQIEKVYTTKPGVEANLTTNGFNQPRSDLTQFRANQFKETMSPKYDDTPKKGISPFAKYNPKPINVQRN